jgi:hypothetical protein
MRGSLIRPEAGKVFPVTVFGFAVLLAACGRSGLDDAAGGTGAGSNGQAGQRGASAGCATEIADLSKELHANGQACTAVVRLDFRTRSILGYQVICAPASIGASEEQALKTALAQTNISSNAIPVSVGSGTPMDEFVFFATPSDLGGIAAVSATMGQSVFAGTIVFGGRGEITYPMTWRPAVDLRADCSPLSGVVPRRGWDAVARTPLSVANVDAADQIVERTAISAAFRDGGNVASVFVLLYPRTVADFDPATAEWIVILNGE